MKQHLVYLVLEKAPSSKNSNATQAQIDHAGEAAFVVMYNGKKSDTLDGLRYKKYCDKVATSLTQVDPKVLPPTSAAAKFQSR